MSPQIAWQASGRDSRRIRRARLRLTAEAPQLTLVSILDEALRLSSLPGENEGRVYYFRKLRLTGLPANGERSVWLRRFQSLLSELAAASVYGGEPRAESAAGVFFASRQEAREMLLHRLLERRPVQQWFWPMLMSEGAPEEAQRGPRVMPSRIDIPVLICRMRQTDASWAAAAESLFALLETADAGYLLQSIPPAAAQAWVQELGGWRDAPVSAPVRLPEKTVAAVLQAARLLGTGDPRTIWLAGLAVVLACPSDLAAGIAVARARKALLTLAGRTPSAGPLIREESNVPAQGPAADGTPQQASSPISEVTGECSAARSDVPPSEFEVDAKATPQSVKLGSRAQITDLSGIWPAAIQRPSGYTPTAAAGLFLFLNALSRAGMASAIESGLAWRYPGVVPRVLLRLASLAGVRDGDSILEWLEAEIGEVECSTGVAPREDTWWPRNLAASRRESWDEDYLVKAWSLAARQWCWRMGRMVASGIIHRDGVWCVNRTDLDVTLPLETADIGIRKLGLDLDPGWLPWFGKVVRFHYRYRGEFHG